MEQRIAVFINPVSGHGKGLRLERALTEELARIPALNRKISAVMHTPGKADDLPAVIETLKGADIAMVCGGDGSVHMMADLILRHAPQTALTVYPLGTGNDFAAALGKKPASLLAHLQKLAAAPEFFSHDAWTLNGDIHFFNYVSFGLDAWILSLYQTVVKHFSPTGLLRFPLAKKGLFVLIGLWAVLFHHKNAPAAEGPCASLIACNLPVYAGGTPFSAHGNAGDGKIELMRLASKLSLLRLAAARFFNGMMLPSEPHGELLLEFTGPVPVQADGEDYTAQFTACRRFTISRAGQIRVCR